MNRLLVASACFLLMYWPATAGNVSWTGSPSNLWTDTLSWDTHKIPTTSDTVYITLAGPSLAIVPTGTYYTAKIIIGGPGSAPVVRLESNSFSRLYAAREIINYGTIEMSATGNASFNITASTIINYGTLTVNSYNGPGLRQLQSSLENHGTVNIRYAASLGGSTQNVNTGTIEIDSNLTMTGGIANNGVIHINAPATFAVNGGTFTHSAGSLSGGGLLAFNSFTTVNFSQDVSTDSAQINAVYSTLQGTGTITVAPGTAMNLATTVVNNRTILGGTLTQAGNASTMTDTLITLPGSVIRLNGPMIFSKGFDNYGRIELRSTLTSNNGILHNLDTIIVPSNGSGAGLVMRIYNEGVVDIGATFTLGAYGSALYTNTGLIAFHANSTLSMNSGGTSPVFTNNGIIRIDGGVVLSSQGGSFVHNSGSLGGGGALSVTSTTATFNQNVSTDSIGLSLVNGTFQGTGTITVAHGTTLSLVGSTVKNPTILGGTITTAGNTSTITDTLMTLPGSVLLVGSSLSMTKGFDNLARIELRSSLYSNSGVLHNLDTIIVPANGAGASLGMRLNNEGVVDIGATFTLGAPGSALYTNTGLIAFHANSTLYMNSGGTAPVFTNNGTIHIDVGDVLTSQGGSFVHNSGSLGGGGAISFTSTTGNFNQNVSTDSCGLGLVNGTFQGTGTITVSHGTSMNLAGSFVKNRVILGGTSGFYGNYNEFSDTLITLPGSVLHVETRLGFKKDFTNYGKIELLGDIESNNRTMTNMDSIITIPGFGNRRISMFLDNRGVVRALHRMTLGINGGTHKSTGVISLSKGVFLTTYSPIAFAFPGVLHFDIGGNHPDNGGAQLNMTGTATFGGTLSLSLIDGFVPEPADTFPVVTYSSRNSQFTTVHIPDENGIAYLGAAYRPTNLSVYGLFKKEHVPELPFATDVPDTLPPGGYHFYKVRTQEGQSVVARTSAFDPEHASSMYAAHESVPSRYVNDFRAFRFTAQYQELNVPSADTGYYYFAIYNQDLTPAIQSIRVDTIPYSLRRVYPASIGNRGGVTLALIGAKFGDSSRVFIRPVGGDTIWARTVVKFNRSELHARFLLEGAPLGTYDIGVIEQSESTRVLPAAVTVESNSQPSVDLGLSGPSLLRRNRSARFLFGFANTMNIDIERAVVVLRAKHVNGYPDVSISGGVDDYPFSPGVKAPIWTFMDDSTHERILVLLISHVSAGSVKQLPLTMSFSSSGTHTFSAEVALFTATGYDSLYAHAAMIAVDSGWVHLDSSFIAPKTLLGAPCPYQGLSDGAGLCEAWNNNRAAEEIAVDFAGIVQLQLATAYIPPNPSSAKGYLYILERLFTTDKNDYYIAAYNNQRQLETVQSFDPNDIILPSSQGAAHWVRRQALQYMIQCENDPDSATSAAQLVRIVHPLNPAFDRNTVQLGSFGFGTNLFDIPSGLSQYQTRLDLRDSMNLFVDVSAGLYGDSLVWQFESIDPVTLLPTIDPLAGFLPLNDSTGKGEAYVTYYASPLDTLSTGRQIAVQAKIYFDDNVPVFTPLRSNTYDGGKPASSVNALTAESPATVNVTWSGTDDGGISGYSVYVSVNGGTFSPWLSNYADTTASFTGEAGKTYGFYVVATDTAGNREATKAYAEATTVITDVKEEGILPREYSLAQNYPNPFNPVTTIRFAIPRVSFVDLRIYNILGQQVATIVNQVMEPGFKSLQWNAANFPSGVYFYRLEAGSFVATKKLLLIK